MLHDYVKDVRVSRVNQSAAGKLPILERHVKNAESVPAAIGVSATQ